MSPATKLSQYLDTYAKSKPGLAPSAVLQLRIACDLYSEFLERPAGLADFNEKSLQAFMSWLLPGRSPRTVNDKRNCLLTLWRHAFNCEILASGPRRVPKLKEPSRLPTAWTIQEVERLLSACQGSRRIHNWHGSNWQALLLTIYDTSHRIGAILQVRSDQLSSDGWLTVLAEQTKHRRDTSHRLHPQTVAAIRETEPNGLLFPWPLGRRQIWIEFKKILTDAGLPHTRRDMFHRLRRTSYTHTFAALGQQAASEHAAHTRDLSRFYLDQTKLNRPIAADVIPRPNIAPIAAAQ